MGNEASLHKRHGVELRKHTRITDLDAQHDYSSNTHIGNSAYNVTLFVDTVAIGNADKIVSCCDVRLTKLTYNIYDHAYVTKNLELINPTMGLMTPHICCNCLDWKTYYKKCI